MNSQIAYRDGGHAALQTNPLLSSVDGEVQTKLRARKQQLRIYVILGDGQNRTGGRQIPLNRRPRAARIGGLQQIGREIGILVMVEGGVGGGIAVLRCQDAADVSTIRDSWKLLDPPPMLAAVVGYLNESVIRAAYSNPSFRGDSASATAIRS